MCSPCQVEDQPKIIPLALLRNLAFQWLHLREISDKENLISTYPGFLFLNRETLSSNYKADIRDKKSGRAKGCLRKERKGQIGHMHVNKGAGGVIGLKCEKWPFEPHVSQAAGLQKVDCPSRCFS